jgi:hypothetical protein
VGQPTRPASGWVSWVLRWALLVCHLSPLLAQTPTSPAAAGQTWNDSAAVMLVRRAIERRRQAQADSTLTSYRARAHGFVFFLAQVGGSPGDPLASPPRLAKADELDVEVYWRAPNLSKQVIRGWRDGAYLPTDIRYHRDHLGIVTNDFGDLIRLGDGDEVRDAVHPLSSAGPARYDYALGDSLAITTPHGRVVVQEVRVRPRDFGRPLVVGTLYLDVATAALVRFRFSFTPAAYLDRQLEDIEIVLENSLYEQRYWLPYRQEVEIRRRVAWLDFPARGIIRARWEIDDYALNAPVPAAAFSGPSIGGLQRPAPGDTAWSRSLEQAVADVAAPINRQDMAALRAEVERIAGARGLSGLPARRLALGSVSDLVHVNRVQGLALGAGGALSLGGGVSLRPYLGYGTADGRVVGELTAARRVGSTEIRLTGARRVEDLSDVPVIAPVLNSILAQEAGKDFGDYVLRTSAEIGVRERLGTRDAAEITLAIERGRSVGVAATPATGTYRPNPPLGAGTYRIARVAFEHAAGGIAVRRDFQGRVAVEGGTGETDYIRATAEGRWLVSLGSTGLLSHVYTGIGSDGLLPYRQFVLGGRGTLLGEPFRVYGGRTAALAQLEWRLPVPVPALPLGSFASTGHQMIVAPFIAAGWAERPLPGMPWSDSDGLRPVAGVAVEWFMRLIRLEAGMGLRTGKLGVTLDVNRDWWGLL